MRGCLMKQKNHKSYIKCVQFISLNLYSDSNSVESVVCSMEICRKGAINARKKMWLWHHMQKINTNDCSSLWTSTCPTEAFAVLAKQKKWTIIEVGKTDVHECMGGVERECSDTLNGSITRVKWITGWLFCLHASHGRKVQSVLSCPRSIISLFLFSH